jgi:hypothetical protein
MNTNIKQTTAAAKRVSAWMAAKQGRAVHIECPECDHQGPHDSNGDRLDPQALCTGCGMVFNVNPPEMES